MEKAEAKKRIDKLKKLIGYHRRQYHVFDRQEISSEALDSLKRELYKLEQKFPELISPDSPTQRIGGEPLKEFEKTKHKTPMLSLEDVFSEKELQSWEKYLKRLAPLVEFEYFCELKIDGFAVELVYEKGLLKVGSTRGDGLVGEDITQNLKTIESIPLRLASLSQGKPGALSPGRVEVRGEVYMGKADFFRLNKSLEKKGEKIYANPRNLAAGSIRQLDPQLAASRPLKFLAYDIVGKIGENHSQKHRILSLLGFKANEGKICKNLTGVVDYWREAAKKRESLPFQVDGIVVSVNENFLFSRLGVAGKSPRGARAVKFSPKQATTRILEVKFQIGRTGTVTPVAILEPVEIDGVTVSRATLHNEDEIKRLGIKIGDTAIIERAGDVIPDIARVLPELREGKEKQVYFPKICPACSSLLKKTKGEALWRCQNANCSARKRENLYHFVSKKAFNVQGLGPRIIDRLIDEGLISRAPDIFSLKEGDLAPLERFAEKSAQNLIREINKSRKISLPKLVFALGIRQIGQETAFDLADYFGSLEKLKKAGKEEFEAISNIGPKTAESIYRWFQSKKNQKLIGQLLEAGVQIIGKETGVRSPEFSLELLRGKTFVLTGMLESMTREEAKEKIRLLGGNISESVSQKTDGLVAGKEPGTKLEKARRIGIKIISEEEFLKIIRG